MRIVAASIVFLIQCNLCAQSFQFKTYTTKDGLSSNTVSYAVKDNMGFLWIATANGLNRFDGNAFDHFTNNPADSNSIAGNEVNNLFIDSKQNLWATTMSGLSLYHPHTQTFSNFAPDSFVLPKIGPVFPAIAEDDNSNIWLGGWYDLLLFNPATKKFKSSGWATFAEKTKPADGNHSRVLVLGIKQKSKEAFWVLSTYGLFSVHKKTLQFQYHPYAGIKDYYGCQLNYIDAAGVVWMGTYNNGLLSYDAAINKWQKHETPVKNRLHAGWDWAYGVTQYSGDTLMYCSQKEILFLTKNNGQITNHLPGLSDAFPLLNHYYNIVKDNHSFWLISSAGITNMRPATPKFYLTKSNGLTRVGRVFPLAGQNFITGNDSTKQVFLFDEKNNRLRQVTNEKGEPLSAYLTSFKNIKDTVSMLSTDEALYFYSEKTNTVKEIKLPPKKFENNPRLVRNMATDGKDKIWIRQRRQGILEYNLPGNSIRYIEVCNQNEQTTFCSMYYDTAKNELWVGVENEGLYIYNTETKKTQHLLCNIAPSQRGGSIIGMCAGADNILYAADYNHGLFVFNKGSKKFSRYTTHDGLLSNQCNFICPDATGNIWLSSTAGLSRFDTASKTFSNYPELSETTIYAAFINADSNGNMYMPSPEGFYKWNAGNFNEPMQKGRLYIRNVFAATLALPVDTFYNFSHEQNSIGFQFGYLLFGGNAMPLLQYQLNGSEWANISNGNTISFSNLAPNKYILSVREKNNPSQWLVINFVIHPPFYKTWWFFLLIAAMLTAIVFVVFKKRLAAVKKQAALKQQITETETMALRAQMNPHFIFNCISSIDNFILDNDKDNASNYLNKFAKLIRNILDNSKNDVVPFWKDWETLKLYIELEQVRSNEKFEYSMQADEALLNGHYKIPPLIVQPYIENAIHHGLNALTERKGQLIIKAALKENVLEYTIKDNGIGRKKAAEKSNLSPSHQSYGMQLTKDRIHLFNDTAENNIAIKDLVDDNGKPAGTEIVVLLHI